MDAGLELTGQEGTNAALEAEKARATDGSASIGFESGGTEKSMLSQQPGVFKRLLAKLPFIDQQQETRHASSAENDESKGKEICTCIVPGKEISSYVKIKSNISTAKSA